MRKTKWLLVITSINLMNSFACLCLNIYLYNCQDFYSFLTSSTYSIIAAILGFVGLIFWFGYGILVTKRQPIVKFSALTYAVIGVLTFIFQLFATALHMSWRYILLIALNCVTTVSALIFFSAFAWKCRSWIRYTAAAKCVCTLCILIAYIPRIEYSLLLKTVFSIVSFVFTASFFIALIVHQSKILRAGKKEALQ